SSPTPSRSARRLLRIVASPALAAVVVSPPQGSPPHPPTGDKSSGVLRPRRTGSYDLGCDPLAVMAECIDPGLGRRIAATIVRGWFRPAPVPPLQESLMRSTPLLAGLALAAVALTGCSADADRSEADS